VTPLELVERARAEGLTLEAAGDRLRVRPKDRLTPELRALLVEYKAEILRALPQTSPAPAASPDPVEVARVLGLPLAELDRVLRVRVPGLEVPLWFVPTSADAAALVTARTAPRGAVWTARELLDLLAVPGLTQAQARTVALAKLEFDGDVVDVRPCQAR
jgi:hypothetical protein